jgi:hypothetical protein
MDIEIGGEAFHKEPDILEQIANCDTWGRGADRFIAMSYERLILMRDLLVEDGRAFAPGRTASSNSRPKRTSMRGPAATRWR